MSKVFSYILYAVIIIGVVFTSCQKQLDYSASDIAALKTAVAALQKKSDSLAAALTATNNNISSIGKSVDSIRIQLISITSQINQLTTQLTSANANINSINTQIAALNLQYSDLLARLNAILAQLTNTTAYLNARIDSLSAAITKFQKRADSLANALSNTNNILNIYIKKVDTLNIQLVFIVTQINQLTIQLTSSDANVSLINAQITLLNQQYAILLDKLNAILALLNISPSSLANGLIAWYPFTGNSIDSSGRGHNGSVFGATLTTDRFGNANSAYSFNGINNYIRVPSSANFNLPDSVSFSAWINTTNTSQGQRIISKLLEGQSVGWVFDFSTGVANSNQIRCILGGANTLTTIPYSTPVLTQNNTWYLITVTYDLSNVRIYVNGQLNTTKSLTSVTPAYLTDLIIGGATNLGAGFFSGKLDEIRIYNRPLTQTEITYLATH